MNLIGPSLLGFHDHANIQSLRKLFADLGVTVNAVVPLGATPDDLRSITRAWLNVPTALELAEPTIKLLRDRFATPYLTDVPYGESGTTKLLAQIARLLEFPHERVAYAARNAKLSWYARTVDAHALSGKRVGVFGSPSAAAGIARVLHDELDMHVEWAGTYVSHGDWLREQIADITIDIIVTTTIGDRGADRPLAPRHRVRHADGAPLGEPLRRAVRRDLAARARVELSARLRAVFRL